MRWRSRSTSFGQCTREGIVAWLSADAANEATVADGAQLAAVRVVRCGAPAPYVRAQLDGLWTDALLALPRF